MRTNSLNIKTFYYIALLSFGVTQAQIVTIPDAAFKNALVNTLCVFETPFEGTPNADVDTNNDGEIQLSEALAVQRLVVSNQGIASVSGIENFQNLLEFDCSLNQLTALDVSTIPYLYYLACSNNQVTALNLNVILPGAYYWLDCSHNLLNELDLKTNTYEVADCSYNQLTQIQFSQSPIINESNFSHNQFTDLVLADGTFEYFNISDNPLVNLTFDSFFANNFYIANTPITSLSFDGMGGDNITIAGNPNLQSIDFKNGWAFEASENWINITDNLSLQVICVDDLGYWYNEGGNIFYNSEASIVGPVGDVPITSYCDFQPGGVSIPFLETLHSIAVETKATRLTWN